MEEKIELLKVELVRPDFFNFSNVVIYVTYNDHYALSLSFVLLMNSGRTEKWEMALERLTFFAGRTTEVLSCVVALEPGN